MNRRHHSLFPGERKVKYNSDGKIIITPSGKAQRNQLLKRRLEKKIYVNIGKSTFARKARAKGCLSAKLKPNLAVLSKCACFMTRNSLRANLIDC